MLRSVLNERFTHPPDVQHFLTHSQNQAKLDFAGKAKLSSKVLCPTFLKESWRVWAKPMVFLTVCAYAVKYMHFFCLNWHNTSI